MLSESHAAFDSIPHCNDCHVNGTRDVAPERCLGCHDHQNLAVRIRGGQGFHASALVVGRRCETCHKEHRGKRFDVMGWSSIKGGQGKFDHKLTGWPLTGKHATTDCAQCHKATNNQGLRVYLGTARACAACHTGGHQRESKDMLACDRCHTASSRGDLPVCR